MVVDKVLLLLLLLLLLLQLLSMVVTLPVRHVVARLKAVCVVQGHRGGARRARIARSAFNLATTWRTGWVTTIESSCSSSSSAAAAALCQQPGLARWLEWLDLD